MLAGRTFDVFDDLLARLSRVPVVSLVSHSSVGTISQEHSLFKYRHLDPKALAADKPEVLGQAIRVWP